MSSRAARVPIGIVLLCTAPLLRANGGPQPPEFSSFAPSDQAAPLDLFSGDFRYTVPVVEVPGPGGAFPIVLSYQSGISPDQEASWAGVGWTFNPGSIARQLRGLPDDFKGNTACSNLTSGDCVATTEDIEPNWTFGLGLDGNLELIGLDTGLGLGISAGLKGYYNSYRGLGYTRTIGLSGQTSSNGIAASVGLNLSSDSQSGFRASPSLSLADTLSVNATYDAISGLSALNVTTSYRNHLLVEADALNFAGYARPTMLPGPGRDMTGWNLALSIKGGGELQGVYANLQAGGFYNIERVKDPNERFNRAVGYLNLEQALTATADVRDTLVLDFNRERDGPIYDDSPNLPIPVITNDLFTLAAPGLAGTFRAYRNDIPWLFDTQHATELLGGAIGFDIGGGLIAKFGGSFSVNGTKGVSGGWDGGDGGALIDAIRAAAPAQGAAPVGFERTYFKLIGEMTPQAPGAVLPGADAPVAVPIKPAPFDITNLPPDYFEAENALSSDGSNRIAMSIDATQRAPRGAVIESFTNEQLDGNAAAFPEFAASRSQIYAQRRGNHIGGFRVTDTKGVRYVYAIPVYNMVHEEHQFSVKRENFVANTQCELLLPPQAGSEYDYTVDHTEQFRNVKKLSPYAITYLLTAVLGPDYIDADATAGPSDGDYGYWVRLDYDKRAGTFAWRRPFYGARFVRGLDNGPYLGSAPRRNDKGYFSYGEREEWYLSAVHTRTHLARFHLAPRQDNFAAAGRIVTSPTQVGRASQRIDRVELFAKDLQKPQAQWVPMQTVRFEFDYSLQRGAPGASVATNGKLTLKKLLTTFERNTRGETSPYGFDYEAGNSANNPGYAWNSADRWGIYRSSGTTLTPAQCANAGVANDPTLAANRSYVDQERPAADRNRESAAWSLRRIVEPSGREVTLEYAADDYALVQDRPATVMTRIVAVSDPNSSAPAVIDKSSRNNPQAREPLRVYFAAPPGLSSQNVKNQLVGPNSRLAYRIRVALKDASQNPDLGTWETVSGYANVVDGGTLVANDGRQLAWLELERVQGFHPFSIAAWQHLRLVQPDLMSESALNGDPNADPFAEALNFLTLADFVSEIVAMIRGIYPTWFDQNRGQQLDLQNSFVRLRVPSGVKYGGGSRLARITYRDPWASATGNVEADQVTGYTYEYRTSDGRSSGVASYEPSDGAEENAVRDALPFTQKVLLSSSYNLFAETPIAESYFPAPSVGYSRVVVRTRASEDARTLAMQGAAPTRTSTIGPVVHEFYTSADFPVRATQTPLSKKRNPQPWMVPIPFLGQITLNSLAATQGYAIALNDMHGKPRRMSKYEYGAAWDAATQDFQVRGLPTESTEYIYRASGGAGGTAFTLDNRLPALVGDAQRAASDPTFGREAELFIDTRRNRTESFDAGLNVNVDLTYALFPIPLVVPMPSLAYSLTEAKTAVTMKVVHHSGVLDRVVEHKGPAETTLSQHLYDAVSGRPLMKSTTNEFGDPVYDYEMPAHWKYPRMGAAYPSSGLRLSLAGAQLVGTDGLLVPSPSIPACDDSTARTGPCLPVGSRFAAGQGANARALILQSADANGLTFRSTAALTAVPGSDATLVESGDANQLELDVGSIVALSDPTTGRTSDVCRWQTTEACGVCYVKETITEPSCLAQAWIASLGRDDADDERTRGVERCPDDTPQIGRKDGQERIGEPGVRTSRSRNVRVSGGTANRTCRVVLVDEAGNEVDEASIEVAEKAHAGAQPPVPRVASLPYAGVSFEAIVDGRSVTVFVYSDCDGWLTQKTRSKPLVDYCDKEHQKTRTLVKNVLSATATLYSDSWPSVTEEVRFAGTLDEIRAALAGYSRLDSFSKGERGIWRTSRDYTYVEDRRQSSNVDMRRDGTFDMQTFDWSDPDNQHCAPNWQWKSQITRYAASGNEVEEIDPIGVRSTALYGHVQRVPIAVAGNARHEEIASEGFEAYSAGVTVSPEQTGEGNYEFHTITSRRELPPQQCPGDIIIARVSVEGSLVHLAREDVPIRKATDFDEVQALLGDEGALQQMMVEIPGISCPFPITGSSRDPSGGMTLVIDPGGWECPPPMPEPEPPTPEPEPGVVPLDRRFTGIRLRQPCPTGPRYTTVRNVDVSNVKAHTGTRSLSLESHHDFMQPHLRLMPGRRYIVSAWVSRDNADVATYRDVDTLGIQVKFWSGTNELSAQRAALARPEGTVIDGWQRIQGTFVFPQGATGVSIALQNGEDRGAPRAFFDDLRLLPEDGQLEALVYDPATLRVIAKLDPENYAKLFSYHSDGTLAQTQQETVAGKLTQIEARMHAAERP